MQVGSAGFSTESGVPSWALPEAVGRVCSQAHSGCWQNPVPWSSETEVPVPTLVVSQGLPLAQLHVSPALQRQQHTTPVTLGISRLSFLLNLSTASSWRKFLCPLS